MERPADSQITLAVHVLFECASVHTWKDRAFALSLCAAYRRGRMSDKQAAWAVILLERVSNASRLTPIGAIVDTALAYAAAGNIDGGAF